MGVVIGVIATTDRMEVGMVVVVIIVGVIIATLGMAEENICDDSDRGRGNGLDVDCGGSRSNSGSSQSVEGRRGIGGSVEQCQHFEWLG
jgi:hypothetical protein